MTDNEPYPGLRPFLREETDIFFGRERQLDRMLEQLREHRFLAVTGTSGSGKSSLVRTGLLSALELGFLDAAGGRWNILDMRPGGSPLDALAHNLLVAYGQQTTSADLALARAALERGPLSIAEFVRRIPDATCDSLFILVDQFEELFRFNDRETSEEAEAFVNLLIGSVSQTAVPIYIALTMRSDFLGECARFEGLPELINRSQYLTPRMSRSEYRQAIEEPARVFGGRVTPEVTSRVLNDMVGVPDQLCLVQHAMLMMWRHAQQRNAAAPEIRVEDYEAIGGVAGSLSRHADQILASLPLDLGETVERMFQCLTEGSGSGADIRRPRSFLDLKEVTGASDADLRQVIEAFRAAGNNFLMPLPHVPITDSTIIDISHESLIRQWGRLREWTRKEAESSATYRRLEQTAKRWREEQTGLWSSRESARDLASALSWRDTQRPSPAWSRRYGDSFDTAMAFLDASQRAAHRATLITRGSIAAAVALPLIIAALAIWAALMAGQRTKLDQALGDAHEAQFRRIIAGAEKELEGGQRNKARALALAGAEVLARDGRTPRDALAFRDFLASTVRPDTREVYLRGGERLPGEVVGAFSANGEMLAWVAGGRTVNISETSRGRLVARVPITSPDVSAIAYSEDRTHIAVLSKTRTVELVRADSTPLKGADRIRAQDVQAVAFAAGPRGPVLVVHGMGDAIEAWATDLTGESVEPMAVTRKSGIAVTSPGGPPLSQVVSLSCREARCAVINEARQLSVYEVAGDSLRLIGRASPPIEPSSAARIDVLLPGPNQVQVVSDRALVYEIDAGERRLRGPASVTADAAHLVTAITGAPDIAAAIESGGGRWAIAHRQQKGNWRAFGYLDDGRPVALSPDGHRALTLETVDDGSQTRMLKIVDYLGSEISCTFQCTGWTWPSGRRPDTAYALSSADVVRLDPAANRFVPVIADLPGAIRTALERRAGSAPASVGGTEGPQVLGFEPDPASDLVYVLASTQGAGPTRAPGAACDSHLQGKKPWIAVVDLEKGVVADVIEVRDGWQCATSGDNALDLLSAAESDMPAGSGAPVILLPWQRTAPNGYPTAIITPGARLADTKVVFSRTVLRARAGAGLVQDEKGGTIIVRRTDSAVRRADGMGRGNRPGAPKAGPAPARTMTIESTERLLDYGFAGKDADRVYLLYQNGRVELWDVAGAEPSLLRTLKTRWPANTSVGSGFIVWSPSYRDFILAATADNPRRLLVSRYDAATGALLFDHRAPAGINDVAALESGETLLIGDGAYRILPPPAASGADLTAQVAAMTPLALRRGDLDKSGLLIFRSNEAQQSPRAPIRADCRIGLEVLAADGLLSGAPSAREATSAETSAMRSYAQACSDLYAVSLPAGLRNALLAQLSFSLRVGERRIGPAVADPYWLLAAGQGDPLALARLTRQMTLGSASVMQLYQKQIEDGQIDAGFVEMLSREVSFGMASTPLRQRLEALAAAGEPLAQGALAMILEGGNATVRDREQALTLYARATETLRRIQGDLAERELEYLAYDLQSLSTILGARRATLAAVTDGKAVAALVKPAMQPAAMPGATKAASGMLIEPTLNNVLTTMQRADAPDLLLSGVRRVRALVDAADRKEVDRLLMLTRHDIGLRGLAREAKLTGAQRRKFVDLLLANLRELPEPPAGRPEYDAFVVPAASAVLELSQRTPDEAETIGLAGELSQLIGRDARLAGLDRPRDVARTFTTLSNKVLGAGDKENAARLALGALWAVEREVSAIDWPRRLEAAEAVAKLLPPDAGLAPYKPQLDAMTWDYVNAASDLWAARATVSSRDQVIARRYVELQLALHRRALDADSWRTLVVFAQGEVAYATILQREGNDEPAMRHFQEAVATASRATTRPGGAEAWSTLATAQRAMATVKSETAELAKTSAAATVALRQEALALHEASLKSWQQAANAGVSVDADIFSSLGSTVSLNADLGRHGQALTTALDMFGVLGKSEAGIDLRKITVEKLKAAAVYPAHAIGSWVRELRKAAKTNGEPGPCDLAAHPDDPFAPGPGVLMSRIDADKAIAGCTEALARDPGNARLLFQRARALEAKSGAAAAKADYEAAARAGYPYAVSTFIDRDEYKPHAVQEPSLQFLNRMVAAAGREVAAEILAPEKAARYARLRPGALAILAWASDLGDAGASAMLGQRLAAGEDDGVLPQWMTSAPADRNARAYALLRMAERRFAEPAPAWSLGSGAADARAEERAAAQKTLERLSRSLSASDRSGAEAAIALMKPTGWGSAPPWIVPADRAGEGTSGRCVANCTDSAR